MGGPSSEGAGEDTVGGARIGGAVEEEEEDDDEDEEGEGPSSAVEGREGEEEEEEEGREEDGWQELHEPVLNLEVSQCKLSRVFSSHTLFLTGSSSRTADAK